MQACNVQINQTDSQLYNNFETLITNACNTDILKKNFQFLNNRNVLFSIFSLLPNKLKHSNLIFNKDTDNITALCTSIDETIFPNDPKINDIIKKASKLINIDIFFESC